MDFNKQKDSYYPKISKLIKKDVPEFVSVFDGFDEIYMILGEFGRFIDIEIENDLLVKKCISFINKSLNEGGMDTEYAFVVQIFMPIYHKTHLVKIYQELLNERALNTFNNFYKESNYYM